MEWNKIRGEIMVIRDAENNHVEFVSYSGEWPNLCRGNLVLRIDGVEVVFATFGSSKNKFKKFWLSGGEIDYEEDYTPHIITGEWVIFKDKLPEKYQKYADEIDEVFNENVPHGCCGGCA